MPIACTPANLSELAKCFTCLSEKEQQAILTYLACQLANGSGGGGVGAVRTIGNGISSGTVSGLGLSAAPTAVVLTVQRQTGNENLWATITSPPTADGFNYELNGTTDAADYVLHIAIIP